MFELFAHRPAHVDLVVRAMHDRALAGGGRAGRRNGPGGRASAMPRFELPARPGVAARTARLSIRFGRLELRPPKENRNLPSRSRWLMSTFARRPRRRCRRRHQAGALAVADHPRRRDGRGRARRRRALCEALEDRGFPHHEAQGLRHRRPADRPEDPRNRLVLACLLAATVVLQMTAERDGGAGGRALRPLTDAFDPEDRRQLLEAISRDLEGRTKRQKNPHPKGSFAFATWVCARLGGWTGYYGKPGPVVDPERMDRIPVAQARRTPRSPDRESGNETCESDRPPDGADAGTRRPRLPDRARAAARPADLHAPTDDDVAALVDRLLADRAGEPVWVFAYGSLIWKPVFAPAEVARAASRAGWHRAVLHPSSSSFRGTPEPPGPDDGARAAAAAAPASLYARSPGADPRADAARASSAARCPSVEIRSTMPLDLASHRRRPDAGADRSGPAPARPAPCRGLPPEAAARQTRPAPAATAAPAPTTCYQHRLPPRGAGHPRPQPLAAAGAGGRRDRALWGA